MNANIKKYLIFILIPFLAALLLEVFVLNFRCWQSLFYKPVQVPASQMRVEGMQEFDGGVYKIESVNGALYLEGLDSLAGTQVHNVWLDLELPDAIDMPFAESGVLTVEPYIQDAGHEGYDALAKRPVRADIEESHYFSFSGAGQIRSVAFSMKMSNGSMIKLDQVVLNARIPMHFYIVRFIVLFLTGFCIVLFWKKPSLWKTDEEPDKKNRVALILLLGGMLMFPSVYLIFQNDYLTSNVNFQPYHELSRALAKGQLYLDAEVPQWLNEMENPYDMSLRDDLSAETGEAYLWDYAYYKGHYYVYYGVVPCILFYLPFYLLTGSMLPNTLLHILFAVFLYLGIYCLIRETARRIGQIPYALQLLLTVCVYLGSLILYFLNQPDAYAVPVVSAVVFTVWGLYLWLRAEETKKRGFLAAGSLCMALVAGCRPHMLLYGLAAVPLFGPLWKGVWKGKEKKEKTAALLHFISFALPYLLVGIALMLYNYLRFASPFNFGQGYNLTVQDGSNLVFSADKIWIGIYEYLLKLPQPDYAFPFLSIPGDGVENNAIGHSVLYMEYVFGGLFACNPLALFSFGIFDKNAKKSPLHTAGIVLGAAAVLVFLADSVMPMAGMVYRYMADFSTVLLFVAAVVLMETWSRIRNADAREILTGMLLLCLLIALLFHVNFYWLSGLKYPLLWGNTALYYKMYYAFMFW